MFDMLSSHPLPNALPTSATTPSASEDDFPQRIVSAHPRAPGHTAGPFTRMTGDHMSPHHSQHPAAMASPHSRMGHHPGHSYNPHLSHDPFSHSMSNMSAQRMHMAGAGGLPSLPTALPRMPLDVAFPPAAAPGAHHLPHPMHVGAHAHPMSPTAHGAPAHHAHAHPHPVHGGAHPHTHPGPQRGPTQARVVAPHPPPGNGHFDVIPRKVRKTCTDCYKSKTSCDGYRHGRCRARLSSFPRLYGLVSMCAFSEELAGNGAS